VFDRKAVSGEQTRALVRSPFLRPIAERFPLAEVKRAHELLGKEGVTGKIGLICNGSSLASGGA
jgi:hypothetical protein